MKISFLIFTILMFQSTLIPFTIMIDPSGDAKETGRVINDMFERAITLQYAQALKAELENQIPSLNVVLSRRPGEVISLLQNASFANKLNVDLYLHISFYQETEIEQNIFLFYYTTHLDDCFPKLNVFSFCPMSQAHLINNQITKNIGQTFLQTLSDKKINSLFKVQGIFGIPFKPLSGIKAPALALEIGLKNSNDWKNIIAPVVVSIKEIVS